MQTVVTVDMAVGKGDMLFQDIKIKYLSVALNVKIGIKSDLSGGFNFSLRR